MKIISFFTLIFSCISLHAKCQQWTTSNTNIYNSNVGNVGIGTSNPASKFEVNGSVYMADELGNQTFYGSNNLAIFGNDGSDAFISCDQITQKTIVSGGSAVIITAPYVGINTSTPTEKLDVSGNVKFSGALMPAGAAGTAGQVLTSAGPGASPVWATPSSGSGSSNWTLTGNDLSNNNTGKVLINTNITVPGTGTATEHFGLNSSTGMGNNSTALGYGSTANTNNSIAIGDNANAAFDRSVAIGSGIVTAGYAVDIGFTHAVINTVGIGNYLYGGMINMGYSNTSAYHTSMLLGRELTATGENELRIGSGAAGWWPTQIYLSGATSNYYAAHFGPQTFHAISGLGQDRPGQGMIFKAGKSTGNAVGGEISFFTTPAGASGTTENTEQERMRIDPAGNVGIGTNNPSCKLHVQSIYSELKFNNGASDLTPSLGVGSLAGGKFAGLLAGLTSSAIVFDNSGPFSIATEDRSSYTAGIMGASTFSSKLTVLPNGNTGIGTTNPSAKLDVAGNIYSSGKVMIGVASPSIDLLTNYSLAVNGSALFTKAVVKLNANWPDYVFSKNYELPTLASVEKFINENSHLPGVASAQEVEKNGVDLGDNQAVLLKKVEELTLYMIDMDKKMQQVQKENAEMKVENKHIKMELENLKAKN